MTHIFGVRVEALFPIAVLVVLSLAASVEAVVYVPQSSRGVLVMTDPRYGYAREETFYADRVIDTIQALEDMGYIVQTEPMPSFPTDVDNFLSRLDQFDRLVITAPRIFWAYTLAYNWNYAYGAYGSSQYYYYSASRDLVKGIISWVEDCNVLIHFGGLQGDLFFSVLAREIYNMPFVRGFNYDDPVLNATSAARQDPNFPGVNGFPYPYGTEKTEAVVSRGISQVLSVQGRDGYYLDSYECLFNLRDYYYVIPSRSVDGDNRPPFAQEMCADMRMSIGGGTMFWFGQTFYDYDYRSNDNNQFESFRDMLEVALQTDIDCDEGSVSIDPPVVGKALVMANPEAGPYRYRGIGGQTLFDSDTLLDAIIHTLNLNYEVEIRDAPSFPHDVPAFLEELYESALLLVDQPRVFWMDSLRRTYSYYASYETYTGPYGNDLGDYYSAQFDFNTGILDWISQCGGTMISLGGENGAEAVLGDFVNNYYGQSYTWFDYYLSGTINYRYSYSYATLAASPDFYYKGILRNTLYTSEVFFDPSPWQNITCIFSPYFNEEIDGPLPPINDKEARPTRSSRSADNYEDDGCTDILIEIGRGKLYFFGQLFADYGYGRDLFYSSRGEFNQYYDLESIMGIAFTDTNFDSPCNPNEPTTPTPSPTASQTTSTTPTPSTSLTATPSRTGTRSPSVTPPSTPTSSPAQTPQGTVSAGGTASATMTLTASPSHTPSSTASPSESSSSTSSPSFSSTQTPPASVSPSMSGTSSVTPSHTSTGTPTPSETPSISDTATPSRTRSATRSSSPTRAPPSSSPSHTRSPDGISKTPTVSQTPVPTPFPTRTPGDEEGSNPPNPVEGPSAPSASPSRSPSPSPSMTILPTPEPEREKCGQIPSYAVQEQVVELTGREQLITIFSEDCSALGDVTIPSGFDGSIKVEQGFINSRCKSIITPMVNLTMITPNGEELATFDFEDHVKICLESFAFVDVDDTCMAFYVGEADDWRCVPFNTQKDATSRYCSVTTHFTSFAVLLTANDGGDSSNDNAFDSTYGWLSLGAVLLAVLIILAVIFVYDIRFRRKRALLNKSLTVHGDTAALISSGSKAPSSSSSSSSV